MWRSRTAARPPPAGSTCQGARTDDLNSSIVEVHIVHPRRGDLVIDLIDPHGRTIRLKSSDPADTRPNMDAQFPIELDPDLQDRLNDGPFRLRVEDVATGAVGYLDRWTLYL